MVTAALVTWVQKASSRSSLLHQRRSAFTRTCGRTWSIREQLSSSTHSFIHLARSSSTLTPSRCKKFPSWAHTDQRLCGRLFQFEILSSPPAPKVLRRLTASGRKHWRNILFLYIRYVWLHFSSSHQLHQQIHEKETNDTSQQSVHDCIMRISWLQLYSLLWRHMHLLVASA